MSAEIKLPEEVKLEVDGRKITIMFTPEKVIAQTNDLDKIIMGCYAYTGEEGEVPFIQLYTCAAVPTGKWQVTPVFDALAEEHVKQKRAAKQPRDLETPEGKIVDAIQGLTITLEKALQEFLGRAEPVIHKYKNLQVETINGSPVRWRQSNGSVWSQWKVVTIQDLESSSYWQAYAGEKESE